MEFRAGRDRALTGASVGDGYGRFFHDAMALVSIKRHAIMARDGDNSRDRTNLLVG